MSQQCHQLYVLRIVHSLCPLICALHVASVSSICLSGCLAISQGFVSSSTSLKASEPAFQHQDEEGCAFQTKIFEVLDMKKEGTQKLWVSNECMVLDAVKKVIAHLRMDHFTSFTPLLSVLLAAMPLLLEMPLLTHQA